MNPIGSIHTLEITMDNLIDPQQYDFLKIVRSWKAPTSTTGERHKYSFNPNKMKFTVCNNTYTDTNKVSNEVTTISELLTILDFIEQEIKPINGTITRIDYRFDEYEIEYETLYKLGKFLTLLIADYYDLPNIFESVDPIALTKETIRAQGEHLAAEFYNKQSQAPKYGIKCRFELRALKLNFAITDKDKIITELVDWIERLETITDKDSKAIDHLLNRLNDNLIERFKLDQSKGETARISQFIHEYRNAFFTNSQLVDFYERNGFKHNSAKVAANKYRSRQAIQCYTPKDLQNYVREISAAANKFITQ